MLKTNYGNQIKLLYFDGHKTKIDFNKIKIDKIPNYTNENILFLEETNSKKLIRDKKINEQNKNIFDGYIYYGNNKIFKTKNSSISSEILSNKMKTQNLFYKVNTINKKFNRNLSMSKENIINNNKYSSIKIMKELSKNTILNNSRKNDLTYQKIKHSFNRSNSNKFPFILNNNSNNDNNSNKNNIFNNINIQFQVLKQLNKNFIESFRIKNFSKNDLFYADYEDKIRNKKLDKKNYSKEWIINNKIKNKEKIQKNRNNNKVNKKSFSIDNKKSNKKTSNIFEKIKSLSIENENNSINLLKKIKIKEQTNKPKTSPTKDNYIFSNPIQNKNFSFHSTKNMKIAEDNSETYNKNILENSNIKINYRTSSYFFSPRFKKENKTDSLNIKEIIKNAIANNIQAGMGKISSNFFNLGKDYKNNNLRKTQNNFYSFSNKNWNKEETKEEKNNENKKASIVNSIKFILKEYEAWEKHENIWENIKNNLEEKNEINILPPNNDDILISIYIKLFKKNDEINNIIITKENYLIININDNNIKNPRNEIKKWKKVYKISILRWHPDKLFPLLTELNLKKENVINELHKRSTIIINNINIMYQKIIEILNKILLNKK